MKRGEVIQKYSQTDTPGHARLLLKLPKLSFKGSAILLYKNIKKTQKIECKIKKYRYRNIDKC